jgi:hypothetical protein
MHARVQRRWVGMIAVLMVAMLVHGWTSGTPLRDSTAHHAATVAHYAEKSHASSPAYPNEVIAAHPHDSPSWSQTHPTCHQPVTRTLRPVLTPEPSASPADSHAVFAPPGHRPVSGATRHSPRAAKRLAALAVQRC